MASPVSGLADSLTSYNAGLWTYNGDTTWSASGMTVSSVAGTDAYGGIDSAADWSLTGSAMYAQLVSGGNQALASWQVFISAAASGGGVQWQLQGGTLAAQSSTGSGYGNVATIAYSAAAMQWLRIRESGGTVYWDYSADGSTWTTLTSAADPVALASVQVQLGAGNYAVETSSTAATWANFNTPPPPSAGTPVVKPAWQAGRNGFPGDPRAGNPPSQAAQFLAAHGIVPLWEGARLWYAGTPQPPASSDTVDNPFSWTGPGVPGFLAAYDVDQPFVMPSGKTAAGRAEVPVQAFGNGADLQVLLCRDNGSGAPVTSSPLASAVIPASHLLAMLPEGTLASGVPALATARNAAVYAGPGAEYPWAQPAVSANGYANFATPAVSGNWTVFVGGTDNQGGDAIAAVASVQYAGSAGIGGAVYQPPLPQATTTGAACITSDSLVFCGGFSDTTYFSNVWSASFSDGTVGAWAAQAALPTALTNQGMATWNDGNGNDYVYVAAGSTTSAGAAAAVASVWTAQAQSGTISAWTPGPPLPVALYCPFMAVVGDWLIVCGGQNTSAALQGATWYSAINPDGSLAGWQAGPVMPQAVYAVISGWNMAVTDSALTIVSSIANSAATDASVYTQSLAVGPDGPAASWQLQNYVGVSLFGAPVSVFPSGPGGGWAFVIYRETYYWLAPMVLASLVSVPLPASGLTAGDTYHLVFRQLGGDQVSDYLELGYFGGPDLAASGQYASRYGTSWTALPGPAAVAATIWDQTPGTGIPLHLVEDSGAKITTLITSPSSGQLLGAAEVTQMPVAVLNPNTLTTSSGSGWAGYEGTFTVATAPSGAPAGSYAGKYVNNGAAAGAMEETGGTVTVKPGGWYQVTAEAYSTGTSVTAGVDWLDSGGNYLSTSAPAVTVTASTWTAVTVAEQAPAGAASAYARVGTPTASGATVYAQDVQVTPLNPGRVSAVTQVTYNTNNLPAGATVLA